MSSNQHAEIVGRLGLWNNALMQCSWSLTTLFRCQEELDSGRPNTRHENSLKEHKKTSEAFPSLFDCLQIKNACGMSAVVVFCQVFNTGYPAEGVAAGNKEPHISEHLKQIISNAFPNKDERQDFEIFLNTCETVRDEMIAHADGRAFDITHGSPVSKMRLVMSSIQDIDFRYMYSVTKKLETAINGYSEQFRV